MSAAFSVAISSDRQSITVTKLTSVGATDTSWWTNGVISIPAATFGSEYGWTSAETITGSPGLRSAVVSQALDGSALVALTASGKYIEVYGLTTFKVNQAGSTTTLYQNKLNTSSGNPFVYANKIFVETDGSFVVLGSGSGFHGSSSGSWDVIAQKFSATGQPVAGWGQGGDSFFTGSIGISWFNHQPSSDYEVVLDAVRQADGKYLVLEAYGPGANKLALSRITTQGQLDTSFGSNGYVEVHQFAIFDTYRPGNIEVSSNQIVVKSRNDVFTFDASSTSLISKTLTGLTDSQSVNTTASLGYAEIQAANTPLAGGIKPFEGIVLPNGKTVLAFLDGQAQNTKLARLNANGSLDTSFGNSGFVSIPVLASGGLAIAARSSGEVYVALNAGDNSSPASMQLYQVSATGSTVTPVLTSPTIYKVSAVAEVGSTGLVYLGLGPGPNGSGYWGLKFIREGGQGGGSSWVDLQGGTVESAVINADGSAFALVRTGGGLNTAQGGGQLNLKILRFSTTGALDSSFANSGVLQVKSDQDLTGYRLAAAGGNPPPQSLGRWIPDPLGLAVDSSGRILVAFDNSSVTGDPRNPNLGGSGVPYQITNSAISVARYLANGTLDNTFGTSGIATYAVSGDAGFYSANEYADSAQTAADDLLSVDAQGNPIIAFSVAGNFRIVKFSNTGTISSIYQTSAGAQSFSATGSAGDRPMWTTISSDQSLIVGVVDTENTANVYSVLKFESNGLLDTKFGALDPEYAPVKFWLNRSMTGSTMYVDVMVGQGANAYGVDFDLSLGAGLTYSGLQSISPALPIGWNVQVNAPASGKLSFSAAALDNESALGVLSETVVARLAFDVSNAAATTLSASDASYTVKNDGVQSVVVSPLRINATPSGAVTFAPSLQSGEQFYAGSIYKLTSTGTWQTAETAAVAWGGHLATVSSAAENQWLLQTFSKGRWIGLNDVDGNGSFTWVNGESTAYTNWDAGQPSSVGTIAEIGVAIHTAAGQWDNYPNSYSAPGIAERGIRQGDTLTASHTLVDADGLGVISYQWYANSDPISGATGNTFTVTEAQAGKAIKVRASYTDALGSSEFVDSEPVTAVGKANRAPSFGGLDAVATHTKGGAAVVLDANVTITDPDHTAGQSGQFDTAWISVMRSGGAKAEDRFVASGALGALIEGQALTLGGTTLGAVTKNSGGELRLTFFSAATATEVNQVAQSIAYQSNASMPDHKAQFQWVFNDGNSGWQGSGGSLQASGTSTVETIRGPLTVTTSWWKSGVALTDVSTTAMGQGLNGAQANQLRLDNPRRTGDTLTFDVVINPQSQAAPLKGVEATWGPHALVQTMAFTPSSALTSAGWAFNSSYSAAGGLQLSASDNTSPYGVGVATNIGTLTLGLSPAAMPVGQGGDLELSSQSVFSVVSGNLGILQPPGSGYWQLKQAGASASGVAVLDGLLPDSYSLVADKALPNSRYVTSADALSALQIAVGLNPNPGGVAVSKAQTAAADVDRDGKVDSLDAFNILKMAVALSTAPAKQWLWLPYGLAGESATRNSQSEVTMDWGYSLSASTTDRNADLVGVLRGDVDGSWVPYVNNPGGDIALIGSGYITGATVLVEVDADRDGVIDPFGGWEDKSDTKGRFLLPSGRPWEKLVAFGGTNLLTNKPFLGELTAPAGSKVVNPITTLVRGLVESSDETRNLSQALVSVIQALGIPSGVNPLSYDPLAVLANADAPTATKAVALSVQSTAEQISNTLEQFNAVISSWGAEVDRFTNADIVTQALVGAIKQTAASPPGSVIDLTSSELLGRILTEAVIDSEVAALLAHVSDIVQVTAAINRAVASASSITDLAKAAAVAQNAVSALARGAASRDFTAAVDQFTGGGLGDLITQTVVGEIMPGVAYGPVGGISPAPLPAPWIPKPPPPGGGMLGSASSLTTLEIQALTTAQIQSIGTDQIGLLSAAQIAAFTTVQMPAFVPSQIAALTTGLVAALSTSQLRALSTSQIPALTVQHIRSLSGLQISALGTAQIPALSTHQVAGLTAMHVVFLTTGQLAAFETVDVAALTTAAISALVTAQIAALRTSQVAALTTVQVPVIETIDVSVLTSEQLQGLTTNAVQALTTAQIAAISRTAVQGLTTAAVAAITTTQITAITPYTFAGLSITQIPAIETRDLALVSSTQLAGISADQVGSFTSAQMPAFSESGIKGLSTAGIQQLSATKIQALDPDTFVGLTSLQIGAFLTTQADVLDTADIAAISATALPGLTSTSVSVFDTAQIAAFQVTNITGLSTAVVNALRTDQAAALSAVTGYLFSSSQLGALGSHQVQVLSSDFVRALSSTALAGFSASNIVGLTTAQVSNMLGSSVAGMTSAAFAVLNTAQVKAIVSTAIPSLGQTQLATITSSQAPGLDTEDLSILSGNLDQVGYLTAAAIAGLTTTQVAALNSRFLSGLTTAATQALSTAQIAAISEVAVAGLTTSQMVALTSTQIAAIETADLRAMSHTQIAAIEAADFAAINSSQAVALQTIDLDALSTAQLAQLPPTSIAALDSIQLGALGTQDVAALTTAQIASLVPGQIPSITTNQLRALTTTQFQAIEATDLASLTTSQVVSLTTSQIRDLTVTQITALTNAQLAALTSSQVGAIERLDLAQISNVLPTSQITYLQSSQLKNIGLSSGYKGWTDLQIPLFTTSQVGWINGTLSPLALDLNGDGVKTLSLADGPLFDIDADGDLDRTGWVSAEDGLLVRDLNGNAAIDDGSELFGEATRLPDGNLASQGFEALASLDADGDGQITSSDPAFGTLKVWRDADADGQTDAGELLGLDALGVTALNTRAQVGIAIDQGNLLGLVSSYQTAEGQTRDLVDVWFRVLEADRFEEKVASLSDALLSYSDYNNVNGSTYAAVKSEDRIRIAPSGVLAAGGESAMSLGFTSTLESVALRKVKGLESAIADHHASSLVRKSIPGEKGLLAGPVAGGVRHLGSSDIPG